MLILILIWLLCGVVGVALAIKYSTTPIETLGDCILVILTPVFGCLFLHYVLYEDVKLYTKMRRGIIKLWNYKIFK